MLPPVNAVHCKNADFLLFATNDAITSNLVRTGVWEEHTLAISHAFLAGTPAPLVLDIGANLGAYAIPMAKDIAARGGSVHAYEPQRIVYYQLCGNIFINRLDNVFAHRTAIGDTDGDIALPVVDYGRTDNIGGFSLNAHIREKTRYVALNGEKPAENTPIARLDSLALPKPPALLKIDVEGLDLQVLQGGVKLLESANYPPLLFEAWSFDWFRPEREKLLEFLRTLGYGATHIFNDDYVAQHPAHAVHIDFETDGAGRFRMNRTR